MTPAKIALGRQLFSDTRLSGNRQMSCATCHAPGQNFTDGRPRSLGASGELDRNAPTVINSAFYQTLFWDGRAASLEEQASGPILAVREMNSTRQQVEALIQTEPDYQRAFQEVFGTPGTFAQVTQAIASFERTLVTGTSAFDRYARGDQQALSAQQKVGLGLFTGRASCTTCHTGPHFSDNLFHNLGVPPAGPLANDPGRFTVTENPRDTRAFRTASLRNVARTAPYFHNGSMATLREVVAFYNGGGGRDANRSNLIRPLRLSAAEQAAMVSFLNSLTDDG